MESLNQEPSILNKMNFGAAIRKLRKEEGLKAYELAEKVGIERTYITKIEKHNKLPSFFVIHRISNLLHSPELLEGYIKIKCASSCEVEEKVKNVLKSQQSQKAP